jgi:hypothetical protein
MNLKNTGSSHANDAKKFELICESTHVTAKKTGSPKSAAASVWGYITECLSTPLPSEKIFMVEIPLFYDLSPG